jgi:copper homeostasis protein CutC
LISWQAAADPGITILVGAGLCPLTLQDLAAAPELREMHVGRAARVPQQVDGAVDAAAVRALKNTLR